MGKYLALLRKSELFTVPKITAEPVGQFARQGPDDATEALALLARLKSYVLPSGRIPAARIMADRVRGLTGAGAILVALQELEREFIALGGQHDSALAEAVIAVQSVFPSSKLIEVKRRR